MYCMATSPLQHVMKYLLLLDAQVCNSKLFALCVKNQHSIDLVGIVCTVDRRKSIMCNFRMNVVMQAATA